MSVESTPAVLIALRDRALTFVPPSGPTLGAILGTLSAPLQGPYGLHPAGAPRFFQQVLPDGLPFSSIDPARPQFYALGTMGTARPAEDSGGMLAFPWEVIVYARPRSAFAAVLRAGDLLYQAYLGWVGAEGRVIAFPGTVGPLPPYPAPADREVVGVRYTGTVHTVPGFLLAPADALAPAV
jgi:hypothetical protein